MADQAFARSFEKAFVPAAQTGAQQGSKLLEMIQKQKEKTAELEKEQSQRDYTADLMVKTGLIDETLRDEIAKMDTGTAISVVGKAGEGKLEGSDLTMASMLDPSGKLATTLTELNKRKPLTDITEQKKLPKAIGGAVARLSQTYLPDAAKDNRDKGIISTSLGDFRVTELPKSFGKTERVKTPKEKIVELEWMKNQNETTALAGLIDDNQKAILEGNKGLMSMFGQLTSFASFKNAQVEEAGGGSKPKMIWSSLMAHPWIQASGYERTGAIPGSLGFTVLRSVPQISGSKQGISALAKLLLPGFPTQYSAKGYSDQMLAQSLDDMFRFNIAVQRTSTLDDIGYKRNEDGQYEIPDKPTTDQAEYIKQKMENIQLTPDEEALLDTMKYVMLNSSAASTIDELEQRVEKKTFMSVPKGNQQRGTGLLTGVFDGMEGQ